jgi:serine protease Do
MTQLARLTGMTRVILSIVVLLLAIPSYADRLNNAAPALALASSSMQAVVKKVGRSVVQVVVTGYHVADDDGPGAAVVRSRSIGSGAVVEPGGYLVTNAHVVAGAERIDVVLPDGDGEETPLGKRGGRSVAATLVGVAPELDLALLKIDADLPPLAIAPPAALKQGELVLAFGSPDGLRNSVSMGLVSASARQVQPDNPIAYIQTDSAINPGNSGGPLVNVDGQLVGLNTFIRTQSGGSEGLGFALPGAVIALAIPQLRDFGHLHRASLGMSVQNITPLLQEGLGLPDDSGLIVANVTPDGPAAGAGLQAGDIITRIDGHDVQRLSFVELYPYLYALHDGQNVAATVQRGGKVFTSQLRAVLAPHDCERPFLLDRIEDATVAPLGIIGARVDRQETSGVLVTARLAGASVVDAQVATGDVIVALNGEPITSVVALRDAMDRIERGHAVVLQIERGGSLTYVAFER